MLELIKNAIDNNGKVIVNYSANDLRFYESAQDLIKSYLKENQLFSLVVDKLEREQKPIATLLNNAYEYDPVTYFLLPGKDPITELKIIGIFYQIIADNMSSYPAADISISYFNMHGSDDDDNPLPMKPELYWQARKSIDPGILEEMNADLLLLVNASETLKYHVAAVANELEHVGRHAWLNLDESAFFDIENQPHYNYLSSKINAQKVSP